MALALPIATDYGVTATYHNIAAAQVNWRDGGCTVVLFSYVDAAARTAGRQPLGSVTITLDADTFNGGDVVRADLYALIKQRAEWVAATDA
jgi:hypothetical protein